MKSRDLAKLGVPSGLVRKAVLQSLPMAEQAGLSQHDVQARVKALVSEPQKMFDDPVFGEAARLLQEIRKAQAAYKPRREPAPWRQWGENLDPGAVEQLENAVRLPVAVAGALMPDAHRGYGLPIGGVLATRNSVIPYAVGVDIACRMKMTLLDIPLDTLRSEPDRFKKAIEKETRFGIGASFKEKRQHAVLDEDWSVSPPLAKNKDRAWSQLGTSGSGNHFVEFGRLTLEEDDFGLASGQYLALLSHSGSRGTGAAVASYFSELAMARHPELPEELKHLAWLDLDSEEGQAYWASMELMGKYASANHELIHHHMAEHLGLEVLADIENHHNFAWKENHFGEELVVHRKGATPAGKDVPGIIPGSMTAPGFVVRGLGVEESMCSAAHGAGRVMSRMQAKRSLNWKAVKGWLRERGVTLLSAGLDEAPMAYKDIHTVMAEQKDLVRTVARFDPLLVKMAPSGEPPED